MSVPARADGTAPLRVILVGRTGLEQSLRRDERLELVRVRTPIQAIGEASGVTQVDAPEDTLVVLSPQSRLELDEQSCRQFLSALHLAAPAAKTAAMGDAASAGPFDVTLSDDCSADDLHRLFGGSANEVSALQSPSDEQQVEALLDRVLDERPVTAQGVVGDEALVAQMLSGHDIHTSALDLLKRRISDESLQFMPGSQERAGTPVIWRGSRLGTLLAGKADAAVLSDAAAWLAAWLAMERQMSQLRDEAFTDPLTGAWNRRFFDRYIVGALKQALKDRRSLTLLMFDIDDFKRFNDSFGHAAGDLILRETVSLMRSVIRPTDKVCRMGGDEFVVIFDDPQGPRDPASEHPESVFDIASRFQQQIAEQRFPSLGLAAPGNLAISGGLATFPWDGRSATELLETADRRTLHSKRQGKNVITIGPGGA